MRAIYVTGTDTNVGKTVVTGLLGRYLLDRGYNVATQKWVQSGRTPSGGDIDAHLKFMKKGRDYIKGYSQYVRPYSFKFPSSPHLASSLEGRRISANRIKKSFRALSKRFDFVIVEGIGGALVPFNNRGLIVDIAKDLRLPVLIVVGNRLGAINHTLLTVEAMKARGMRIIGAIFNEQAGSADKTILTDNIAIVRRLTGIKVLGSLPRLKAKEKLYGKFIPIGRNVLKGLGR